MELAGMFAQLRELAYKRQLHIADLVQLEAPIVEQRGIINGHIQAVDDAIAGVRKQIVDEKKAIAQSKASGEALPGVELVESLTFAIHPPKEKK